METLNRLEVVRIPCNEHLYPLHLTSLKLLEIGTTETSDTVFKKVEKDLGHIPDVGPYITTTVSTFSWTHRSLAKLSARKESGYRGTPVADYMMYLCLDEKSKLPRNRGIEKLSHFSKVTVYGDAFVFKMAHNGFDELGRARYIHMDEFFVESARTGVHAGRDLRRLLKSTRTEDESE